MDNKEAVVELIEGNLIDVTSGIVIMSKDDLEREVGSEVSFVNLPSNELAVGISMPSTIKTPKDYLQGVSEYKFYNSNSSKDQLEVCGKLYRYEGIVGSVIDMYVDMANTNLILQDLDDEEANTLFNAFAEKLNSKLQITMPGIKSFIDQGMTHWFVYGNAFPYKSWRKLRVDKKVYEIPNITYLNPLSINIDESKIMYGEEDIYLNINSKKTISNTSIKFNKPNKDVIKLNSDNITHIKRKPVDWEAWGIPFLVRVFSPIASKKRLRKLDDTTTEGMINYLTIFKIGSSDPKSPYHKVSLARLNAFAQLIKNPTASTTLIWPHDLEVVTTGPDGKVLDFKDKYAEVDADVLKALGVAPGIIAEGRVDESSILVLIETLETVRNVYLAYIKETFDEILERNNINADNYTITFSNIKLSDILQKLKSLILSYYDRGLLSYETALTLGGHSFKQEIERKEKEAEYKEAGLFDVPNLPFSTKKTETSPTTRDDGRPEDKVRTEDTKIDNDIKLDKPDKNIGSSKADLAYIGAYKDGMLAKYNSIRDRIVKSVEDNQGIDESEINLIIAAGFIELKNYARKALKLVYDIFNEDLDVDEKDLAFQKVEGWNTTYLDKFRDSILTTIKKGVGIFDEVDAALLVPLIITAFEKESYRMNLYAAEGFVKAKMAGIIETQAREGAVGGYWMTMGDDRVCDTCAAKDGNWYKNDEILDVFPSHPNCFDKGTEVLTDEGWKLFKDLKGDERILSVDPYTKNSEYVEIANKVSYKYSGELSHYTSRNFDLMVTPDHDHVINYRKWGNDFKFIRDSELRKWSPRFVATIPEYKGENRSVTIIGDYTFDTKEFVEFMGYYLSDGSMVNHKKNTNGNSWEISITQQKSALYDRMADLYVKLFGKVWKSKGGVSITIKDPVFIEYIRKLGKSYEKYVPEDIKNLSVEYIRIFLDAFISCDGYIYKASNWQGYTFRPERTYFTSSNRLASDIGELLLKIGRRPSYKFEQPKTIKFRNGTYTMNRGIWIIRENYTTYPNRCNITKTKIPYDDCVYDVELVKYHTLFVRRNGKVVLSGNCRCEISWTNDNPLLASPENNNTVVVTTTDKPNKPL